MKRDFKRTRNRSLVYHAFTNLSLGSLGRVLLARQISFERVLNTSIDRSIDWCARGKEVKSKSRISIKSIEIENFESSKRSEASKLSFDVGVF